MAASVDDFVQTRVQPQHRAIVEALRKLMHECAPASREVLTYGIVGWRARRIVAVISPTKKDITFAFEHGADFVDPYGLLKGVGRVSKHVKLKSLADSHETALRDYIRQAHEFDAK